MRPHENHETNTRDADSSYLHPNQLHNSKAPRRNVQENDGRALAADAVH